MECASSNQWSVLLVINEGGLRCGVTLTLLLCCPHVVGFLKVPCVQLRSSSPHVLTNDWEHPLLLYNSSVYRNVSKLTDTKLNFGYI